MITITDKSKCCGCAACVQKCPKHCIEFVSDSEGFSYPHVDANACINCGLCENVCPVLRQESSREPYEIYSAHNDDGAIRYESSSGGIFSLLANIVIEKNGVVFGAVFNEKWEVVHDFTESNEGLEKFRGSKYVQSKIGVSYIQVEFFLKKNRTVLFSGTPCQVAGLKRFLRKDFPNLITVDFVCHGVPSPAVWLRYLQDKIRPLGVLGKNMVSHLSLNDVPAIAGISFRDKRNGWKKFGFSVYKKSAFKADKNLVSPSINEKTLIYESLDENVYLRGFIRNLFLRPSCYHCSTKSFKSGSDYTLADFWGAGNYVNDDDKGISLLFIHDNKLGVDTSSFHKVRMEDALSQNPAIFKSAKIKSGREIFFCKIMNEKTNVEELILKYAEFSFKESLRNEVIRFLARTKLLTITKMLLRK